MVLKRKAIAMNPSSISNPQFGKRICFRLIGSQIILQTPIKMVHSLLHDINHKRIPPRQGWKQGLAGSCDDSNHPSDWWDVLHKYARDEGHDGAREPFMYLTVEHADGYIDRDPSSRMPRDVQTWVPKSTIYLDGSAYQNYVLDPDTGIARTSRMASAALVIAAASICSERHAEYHEHTRLCPSGGG